MMTDAQALAALDAALARHGCTTGTLHLMQGPGGPMRLAAQRGLPPQVAAIVATVPVGKGMAGLAAERAQCVQTCNLQSDTSGDIRPGAKAVPVQASIAVPIIAAGAVHGVIGFARPEHHEWTAEETAALLAEAALLAAG